MPSTSRQMPIALMPQPDSLIPLCYTIHISTTTCRCCGTASESSTLYAQNEIRSRTGSGAMVRNLVPISRLTWNVPTTIVRLEPREIPLCHECVGTESAAAMLAELPDGRLARQREIVAVAQARAEARVEASALRPKDKSSATKLAAMLDIL